MEISVNVPSIGFQAYFTFKEPFNTFFKAKYNLDSLTTKLSVISVISMRDMIRNDLRDPFTEIYEVAGLTEVDYKTDLLDNLPIVSFSFRDLLGVEKYLRCPLNYIESYTNISNIEYINKLFVIDLNKLPVDLDLSVHINDLKDFIESRVGITPDIKEVSVGDVELVDLNEHNIRETIRTNAVTVHKTLSTQLQELNLKYNELLNRLQTLGITLG
jgi:hypothetical protein